MSSKGLKATDVQYNETAQASEESTAGTPEEMLQYCMDIRHYMDELIKNDKLREAFVKDNSNETCISDLFERIKELEEVKELHKAGEMGDVTTSCPPSWWKGTSETWTRSMKYPKEIKDIPDLSKRKK